MRVMVIVKATKDSEEGVMHSTQLLTEMGAFNEELVKSGMILAGDGRHPSNMGVRVAPRPFLHHLTGHYHLQNQLLSSPARGVFPYPSFSSGYPRSLPHGGGGVSSPQAKGTCYRRSSLRGLGFLERKSQ